jgi:hypothetical protein
MQKPLIVRLVLLCTLFSGGATAATVLDQAHEFPDNVSYNGFSPSFTWQQGVTAGVTGLLSSIDLHFRDDGSVNFFVNLGAPWQADANDYQDTSLDVAVGWNSVDVSAANIFINSGDIFSIGLTGINVGNPLPRGSGGVDAYTDGTLYLNGFVYTEGNSDFNFRTYVEVVPVPAAVWLFGTALIGLIGFGKPGKTARRLIRKALRPLITCAERDREVVRMT